MFFVYYNLLVLATLSKVDTVKTGSVEMRQNHNVTHSERQELMNRNMYGFICIVSVLLLTD